MIKILYIRDRFGKNHGTVAYDISNRSNGLIKFAVASCNSKDSFSKQVGAEVSKSRLDISPIELRVRPNCQIVDVVQSILKKISRSDIGSSSLRKLSRKMLRRYDPFFCEACCC